MKTLTATRSWSVWLLPLAALFALPASLLAQEEPEHTTTLETIAADGKRRLLWSVSAPNSSQGHAPSTMVLLGSESLRMPHRRRPVRFCRVTAFATDAEGAERRTPLRLDQLRGALDEMRSVARPELGRFLLASWPDTDALALELIAERPDLVRALLLCGEREAKAEKPELKIPVYRVPDSRHGLANALDLAGPNPTSAEAPIHNLLDRLYYSAAEADLVGYFGCYTKDAIFFGTDPSERWTMPEFREWSAFAFERPSAWRLVPHSRNVTVLPGTQTAMFDEVVVSDGFGESRGTGVAVMVPGQGWKLAQYNLSVPIPNAHLKGIVRLLANPEQLQWGGTNWRCLTPKDFETLSADTELPSKVLHIAGTPPPSAFASHSAWTAVPSLEQLIEGLRTGRYSKQGWILLSTQDLARVRAMASGEPLMVVTAEPGIGLEIGALGTLRMLPILRTAGGR